MKVWDRIIRWLQGKPSPQEEVRQAVQMVLAGAVSSDEIELDCDQVLDLLDQYAEAVQNGQDAARLMPLVSRHLDRCADCREEYEALLRILQAEAQI